MMLPLVSSVFEVLKTLYGRLYFLYRRHILDSLQKKNTTQKTKTVFSGERLQKEHSPMQKNWCGHRAFSLSLEFKYITFL